MNTLQSNFVQIRKQIMDFLEFGTYVVYNKQNSNRKEENNSHSHIKVLSGRFILLF